MNNQQAKERKEHVKCELTFIALMAVAIMTGCASQSGQTSDAHQQGDHEHSLMMTDNSKPEQVDGTDHHLETETTGVVEIGNKVCPVSGEKVGEMGEIIKYEYNGKIYNLCCPMCVKDFKKDPEKYSQTAEDMN